MNAKTYCKVLEESLVPFLNKLKGDPVFIEDNTPIHKAQFTTAWREDQNIKNIRWPPQSPDLSPIENIWAQLKLAVESRKPREKNIAQLLVVLQEEWNNLRETNNLCTLVKSMPKRVQLVINMKGMPIRY